MNKQELLQDIVEIVKRLDDNEKMIDNLQNCVVVHYGMASNYRYSYHDLFKIIHSNFNECVFSMNTFDTNQFLQNAAPDRTWYVGYHHRSSGVYGNTNSALPEYNYWRAMLTSYCSFLKFQPVTAFPFPLK
jgi:hypothetical protein